MPVTPIIYDCGITVYHNHSKCKKTSIPQNSSAQKIPDCGCKGNSIPTSLPGTFTKPSGSLALVTGTYNRKSVLQNMINSVRAVSKVIKPTIIVVDGGSTDGTKEWLIDQSDVILIQQSLPLVGAVRAFNLGFSTACDEGYHWIGHLNDDIVLQTPEMFDKAISLMQENRKIGEVAFEHDLRGKWGFDSVKNGIYANFGIVRRSAGMMVSALQGDPSGRTWWNPIYRTYGADSEFGSWLNHIGWSIMPGYGLRIHDVQTQDDLRNTNVQQTRAPDGDSSLYHKRWESGCPIGL